MFFDLADIPTGSYAKLLNTTTVPRPIAWVVSQTAEGALNAAPFSYFNVMSTDPPIVAIGIGNRPGGGSKDSLANILETRQFVVNFVSYELRHLMNISGADYDAGIDEIEKAGLTTTACEKIAVPRIAESPAAYECELFDTVDLGNGRKITLGRVLAVHIADDKVLDAEKLYIDTPKLDLVGRLHGRGWYCRLSDLFDMPRLTPEQADSRSGGDATD